MREGLMLGSSLAMGSQGDRAACVCSVVGRSPPTAGAFARGLAWVSLGMAIAINGSTLG